ncbi:MAG: hypothetical protein EB059_08160 [Alphaproteobacteria bacterium]|nr:hypothetical protein [Alphaproteobacteria bacterium]
MGLRDLRGVWRCRSGPVLRHPLWDYLYSLSPCANNYS